MATLPNNDTYDSGVYELAIGDPVLGGTGGQANMPGQNLANRTTWLKNRINRILSAFLSATGVGNGASVGTTVISTYAMPANTLANVGDELEFDMVGQYSNNDNLNLHLKVNGSDVYLKPIGNATNTYIKLSIKIARIASASQILTAEYMESDISGATVVGLQAQKVSALTMNLAAVNTITFEVQNLAGGANQFIVFRSVISINRAQ